MPGICGVMSLATGEVATIRGRAVNDVMSAMLGALALRGGDRRMTSGRAGVLAAVAAELDQPGSNESQTVWAVVDGPIFERTRIAEQLRRRGHGVPLSSGAALLTHLYEDHSSSLGDDISGEAAFAVWDETRRCGVVVRDRLGVKPLYYAVEDSWLIFASELKAVIASGVIPLTLDSTAVRLFLSLGYVPAPHTLLRSVSKLPAGHRLVCESGSVRVERYWHYPAPTAAVRPGDQSKTEQDWSAELLHVLASSAQRRMEEGSDPAVLLSGGVDSSLLVGLLSRSSVSPVKTYTVALRDMPRANELAEARIVSTRYKTDHHELEIDFRTPPADLSEIVWHLDEPVADASALGLFALTQLASGEGITTIVSGAGADGMLGGFPVHRTAALASRLDRLPATLRKCAAFALRSTRGERAARGADFFSSDDPVARYLIINDRLRSTPGVARDPEGAGASALMALVHSYVPSVPADALQTYIAIDEQLSAVDSMLYYIDRTSRANGVEVRLPFFDPTVVELCSRIPTSMKVRGLKRKVVLKTAARGLVPDEILKSRKVGFFSTAVDSWIKAEAERSIDRFFGAHQPRCLEFVEQTALDELLRTDGEQRTMRARQLLPVLMLEAWLSSYLPRAATP